MKTSTGIIALLGLIGVSVAAELISESARQEDQRRRDAEYMRKSKQSTDQLMEMIKAGEEARTKFVKKLKADLTSAGLPLTLWKLDKNKATVALVAQKEKPQFERIGNKGVMKGSDKLATVTLQFGTMDFLQIWWSREDVAFEKLLARAIKHDQDSNKSFFGSMIVLNPIEQI